MMVLPAQETLSMQQGCSCCCLRCWVHDQSLKPSMASLLWQRSTEFDKNELVSKSSNILSSAIIAVL